MSIITHTTAFSEVYETAAGAAQVKFTPTITPAPTYIQIKDYFTFTTRQRDDADLLPSRAVEQEILDLLDEKPPSR